ncbi:pyruvate dehydrogenase phosphatase regulatory subunit, mitochondrial-like isoform X1 [Ruditapes philippinarum]|uniref:pyruvate dehydrogenase phosphatase regulatory subunit, mitochondrial-like isoform X1 n=1 Tax=Ruditapes philippinarum TaxID=129788 RepID=UPI00295C2352|nr:pyruvate dehydrogenase phosphatase regulatory subunit, mitochondrial-like isoform X1 [Ruditapes philippinarum]
MTVWHRLLSGTLHNRLCHVSKGTRSAGLGLSWSCLQKIYRERQLCTLATEEVNLPKQARVVVCGGGVIGTSVAYHLSLRGWNDVVVLEQGQLGCGTTWHSVGLVAVGKDDPEMMKLLQYSRNLYDGFEQEEDGGIGWKKVGSIEVAQTKDRLISLKRKIAMLQTVNEEAHLLLPKDVKDMCPHIKYTDLQGALWMPNDGVCTATDLVSIFARKAKQNGVKIAEGVSVNKVLTKDDAVHTVETSHGNIQCEYFINCAGQWARELGKKTVPKVRVPVHSCEHYYIVTQPIPGMDTNLPVIRDPDGHCYFREWNGGVMAGGFEPPEHGGKPVFHKGIPPKFEFQLLPEDWDQFHVLLEGILNRMPQLNDAQIRQLTNGPESFTPDQNWILGESSEVYNYYVAAGMHSRGIQGAGGVGKYLSELIIDGYGSLTNLWPCDIQRFVPHHSNKKFLRDRVKETIALYHLKYSYNQFSSGRNLRSSPIHTQLKVSGAKFGETNAYERAMWFVPDSDDDVEEFIDASEMAKGTFGKPGWFNAVKLEYQACKERVCLVDMSSFTKIEIKSKGTEALEFLQYMCSNDIGQGIGTVIHTGMLNKQGGYENDCSIVPLRDNTTHTFSFFLIAPTTQQTRCMFWLQKHLPKDGSVQVRDVTSMYSGLNLIGPHAEQLLNDVTDTSTRKHDFKPMTCQVIDVGYASNIITMRLTHCGEDGFVMYIPSEYALHVYEMLMKTGKDYGIRNAGYMALRHLRIEKLFAYWGTDMDPMTTPYETGRDFRVSLDRKDFIGKEALLKQKEFGISKKFCQLLLENFDTDAEVWPSGKEPIYRNGKLVGLTTSSAYGFTLDRFVCLGYINHLDDNGKPVITKRIHDYIKDPTARYEIDVAGTRYPVQVGIYTPKKAYKASDKPTFIPVPGT